MAACGGGGDDGGGDIDASVAVVELGTGMVTFEPIAEGDPMPLIAGSQGGHHFVLHARMMGLTPGDARDTGNPDNPSTLFIVINEAGDRQEISSRPYTLGYEETGDGWFKMRSARIVEIIEANVDTLIDRPVRLRVEVQDVEGRVVTDEIMVEAFEVPLPR